MILNKKYCIENGLAKAEYFELPERIVQFGTGVLLRGLVDYLIDKANRKGIFNARAVVIKTTDSDASDFPNQDCVFTLNEKGIDNQQVINQSTVITALSRLMNASDEWSEILALAEKPEMDIIISNTTEAGIKYVEEDIFQMPPKSFPAKLTAYLYKRFEAHVAANSFAEASADKSAATFTTAIIPTELLVGNGEILRGMVLKHAERHNLDTNFIHWLKTDCRFCNSLVDRIVPGATPATEKLEQENALGYTDNLMINSEPFLLWAIEGDDFVKEKLSFAKADNRMVVAEDITQFREQKLRLLNGGHTISVPLAFLSGFKTVRDMMSDPTMGSFVEQVIKKEILPTLDFDASDFANAVLDRFKNPFIEHKLLSITVQCTAKMNARNSATIMRYFEKFNELPPLMMRGFAAYLLFTKPVKSENGQFFGQNTVERSQIPNTFGKGPLYPIQDDAAAFFESAWVKTDATNLTSLHLFVEEVLSNEAIFDKKLKELIGFKENIAQLMFEISSKGFKQIVEQQALFTSNLLI
jgi:tagaturonate reductase